MSLIKDVILYIARFLTQKDIVAVGSTCHYLKDTILDNESIWYAYIISNWPIDLVKSYIGIGRSEIGWKQLISETKGDFTHICNILCKYHIRQRLEAPPSSKQFLRFYITVPTYGPDNTRGTPIPDIILTGVEYDNEDNSDLLCIRYTAKDGAYLQWYGEGGIRTAPNITYTVDRLSTPPKVSFYMPFGRVKQTTLSKKNYNFIGQIVHKDPEFYMNAATPSYNFSTAHSYHRSGNAPTGIGSSTSNLVMPRVGVIAISSIDCSYDPQVLYKRFILYVYDYKDEEYEYQRDD